MSLAKVIGANRDLELGFEGWFVEARQSSSSVGGLKLGRGDPLGLVLGLKSGRIWFEQVSRIQVAIGTF